jgi:hypothetical protein
MQQRRLSLPGPPGDHLFTPIDGAFRIESLSASTKPMTIGILGASTAYNHIHIKQLTQTIKDIWGMPSKVILQQSGDAAIFIEAWAEDNNIPVANIVPEWARHGPRACILVNNKIECEATHLVIIRSPRAKSDTMLNKANFLSAKKHKECLVLMNIENDGSIVVDHYEASQPATKATKSLKKEGPSSKDIREMLKI